VNSHPRRSGPFPYASLRSILPSDIALTPHLPEHHSIGKAVPAILQSAIVIFAVLTYFLVRGLMSTSVDRAQDHAHALLGLERSLGIAHEEALQQWAQGVPGLSGLMNSIYIYGHWPVIAGALGWLLWKHGDQFRVFRNAMVISGLIGFACFALFPMAPPRFLPELGFVDTVTRDTSAYRVLQPPAFTNQYAAMPSLHVGWNLLMGIAIFQGTQKWFWRVFAVLMPLVMYIATILTANHFVLDGMAGSLVALVGLTLARQIANRHRSSIAHWKKHAEQEHVPVRAAA
jgi:hypothetical protein